MKFHVAVIVSLTSLLAPALAKSVPKGASATAPAAKLGYNADDPNLAAHKTDKDKSSAIAYHPSGSERSASEIPLQNLGVVPANNPNSQPSVPNSFFSFKGSTNPVTDKNHARDQKSAK